MLIGADWLTDWLCRQCGYQPESADHAIMADKYAEALTRAGLETIVLPAATDQASAAGSVPILECSPTPNRGDCLSALGVARELALSMDLGVLSTPTIDTISPKTERVPEITLSAPEQCPLYAARLITGVNAEAASPEWLQYRLRQAGMESINGIVDVSNFVLLELGQPTHAFDYDRIKGRIQIRMATAGQDMHLLNDQTIRLEDDCLLIASGRQPLALAGIMGGEDSSVTSTTGNIMLESAVFAPIAIWGRPMRYNLHTESSHRFERGVDSTMTLPAMERVTALILEICGGEPGPVIMRRKRSHLNTPATIRLHLSRLNKLLGLKLSSDEVEKILTDMQTQPVKTGFGFRLRAPSWRPDIKEEVDVAEEIMRLYGCDRIPETPTRVLLSAVPVSDSFRLSENLSEALVARDYQEVCTASFIEEAMAATLNFQGESLPLSNPMSANQAILRKGIWPGLIQTLRYNLNRQQLRVRLFEVGPVFRPDGESTELAGLAYGDRHTANWDKAATPVSFYDVKQDVGTLLRLCRGTPDFRRMEHPSLHPGRAVSVFLDEQQVGCLGELHPQIVAEMELPMPPILFLLDLDALKSRQAATYTLYSDLPRARRDLALIVPESTEARDLLGCVRDCCQRLQEENSDMQLENIQLFDVFTGASIGEGNKSMAISLIFQKFSSSIEDAEVDHWMDSVFTDLQKKLSATLRKK